MAHVASHSLWDPLLFNKALKVVGIKIPSEKTAGYLKALQGSLLKQRNFKPVQNISTTSRLVLLDPKIMPTFQSVMSVPSLASLIASDTAELVEHSIDLNYDSFTLDDALRLVLPPDTPEIPTSFETVGHIAHVNLKQWLLPFKHIIGQMILDVRAFKHSNYYPLCSVMYRI